MKSQERDQERVLKVLQRYKEPRSVDQIAITAGLDEPDARWACQVLQRKGKLTTVAGGNYELVAKETVAVDVGVVDKRFGRGQLQEAVVTLLESPPRRAWTAEEVGTELGISKVRASEILSRSKIAGKIDKPAWGLYEAIKKPEEPKPQFKPTSPKETGTAPAPTLALSMTITVTDVTYEKAARLIAILNEEDL